MKREIKFRALDKFNNRWVNLFDDEEVSCTGASSPEVEPDGIAKYWLGTAGESDYVWMQYTGLKDKNGKDIFEGDIIQINDWNGATGEHIAEVYWCESYLNWSAQWLPKQQGAYSMAYIKKMLRKGQELPSDELGNLRWPQVEIIGNIYENPELLTTQTHD